MTTSTPGSRNHRGKAPGTCSGALASEAFPCPHGIYVLDSQASTTNINGVSMRDANLRTNGFVTGYALRADWTTMEPAPDQFDFTLIDWNVRRLSAAGKKLSFLFMNTDPAWIAQTIGVTTWYDTSLSRNRAVPWDAFLLTRFETFLHALAEHTIDGVKFKATMRPAIGAFHRRFPRPRPTSG